MQLLLRLLAFSPLFVCQFGISIWFANLVLLSTLICRKKITRAQIVACFADCLSCLPAVAERLFCPFGAELLVCARSRGVRVF